VELNKSENHEQMIVVAVPVAFFVVVVAGIFFKAVIAPN
jgi:hypothetical protein